MERIGPEFMRGTRYDAMGSSEQRRGLPAPPLEMPVPADAPVLELPRFEDLAAPHVGLATVLTQRTSVRTYARGALRLEELAWLLWCTQGVKEVLPNRAGTFRTVPSAGARHAMETFLLANRVDALGPGLHRYLAIRHAVARLWTDPDIADRIAAAALGQDMVPASAVTFLWVADVHRMTYRYGQRGYRYLHLDAGHIAQNLYLAAEAIGCGACAIAAFDDQAMNDALGLDGENQFVIYLATVGRKPAR